MADRLIVFVEEDVAASQVWQEAEDGQTDGLRFLPGIVLFFVLCSPEAARFKSAA
jgi:hypothetical protein